ncbi:7 transmembrane receptor [Dirofilaria immitis]|nr:7 transmembrane receptor [Dirofilaria immitis]
MKRIRILFEASIIILFNNCLASPPLCAIYDPFQIQPDNNEYQIGATFPLHDEDCVKLRVETVQDIVIVQWALTHWNQNSKSSNLKTGLYAGDTCSKPKEAISQTLKFLDSLGFYEPDECKENQNFRKLLGLFLPKDAGSAKAVASVLQTTPLPLLAYSYAAADELTQMNIPNFATTAPTLIVFIDVTKLLVGKNFGTDKMWVVAELNTDEQQTEIQQPEFVVDSDIQMYNCTISNGKNDNDCSKIDIQKMALSYKQTSTAEPVIRAVYAFTAVAARLEKNQMALALCAKPSSNCTKLIMTELESLIYEFDANDPAELVGTNLHFYWESNTTLMSNGIVIEGIEMIQHKQLGPMEVKIMEYETGIKPRFAMITPQSKKFNPHARFIDLIAANVPVRQKLTRRFFDFHGGRTCQSYRNSDISLPLAFLYTLTTFYQRYPQINLLRNLDIGAILVDSCSSGWKAAETVVLAENHCFTIEQGGQNITIVPGSVFGYASALSGRVGGALKGIFVSGDSLLLSLDADHDTTLDTISTMPSRKQEILALLNCSKSFLGSTFPLLFPIKNVESSPYIEINRKESSSLSTYQQFEKLATESGICIAEVKTVNGEEVDTTTAANVTILFTNAFDAATYFTAKFRRESPYPHVYIVNGGAHDFYLHDPSNVARFVGTISLQPKDVIHDEFRAWLESITPLSLPEKWYWEYVENQWQCALSEANRNFYEGKMCTGDELLDLPSLGRMTKGGYFLRGLERFLFAVDAVYKRLCPEQLGVCDEFYVKGRTQISKILKKAEIEHDFVVYEFVPDGQGSYAYRSIANYSIESGFKFSEPYKYFGVLGHASDEISQPKCFLNVKLMKMPSSMINQSGALAGSYIRRVPATDAFPQLQFPSILDRLTAGQWRLQTWNYALAAIITVMLIGALGVLFLAVIKLYFRVIKGNQSLGLSLLVGVIVLYITGYVFIFESTDTICRLRIVLHPVGYAFCFGLMIVKATQLKNAESLAFSSADHISYWNYWLLLLFIMGVQIAFSSKWLTEEFASMTILDDGQPRLVCKYGSDEFLLSQAYVIILLLLTLCLNSTSKNIKRNHKETKWLFISSLSCAILWIIWIMLYLLIPPPYKDTVIVIELLLCASVLLGFIFGPKIYIMLSYESAIVEMHPQNVIKDFVFDNDLLEKVKEQNARRISSPSNSLELCKNHTHSICGIANCKNSPACVRTNYSDDDQVPIFRTVMRKKIIWDTRFLLTYKASIE